MAFAKKRAAIETHTPTLEEEIADESAKLARLQKLESETVKVAAEAFLSGARAPEPEGRALIRQTAELLYQGIDVLDVERPRDRQLVLDERLAAIREAIRIAQQRLTRLMQSREAEVEAAFIPFWHEHLGRVIALVDGLRELAADRHALISRWADQTGFRPRPIGSREADEMLGMVDVFNPGNILGDTDCGRLLDAARRVGIR